MIQMNLPNKIQLFCSMLYDPDNPVVQLCARGIEKEASDPSMAAELYLRAWEEASSPLEACTAAHYLARVQSDPGASLRWNLVALEKAELIAGGEIEAIYPSLHLNVAYGYEQKGDPVNREKALKHYLLAQRACGALASDGYGGMIRKGIEAGLERMR
jgi:hypothetical protein